MNIDELTNLYNELKSIVKSNPDLWLTSESDIQYIARAILNEINTQKQERTKAQNEEEKVVTKRLEFKDANDYVEKMIAYARRI
jgi:hypothetical protein